jgi:C4-dicarboxylate transporter DctM subunit
MALESVPQQIADILLTLTNQGIFLVIIIVALLSMLALFIEAIANILLWALVFAPLVAQVGVDSLRYRSDHDARDGHDHPPLGMA